MASTRRAILTAAALAPVVALAIAAPAHAAASGDLAAVLTERNAVVDHMNAEGLDGAPFDRCHEAACALETRLEGEPSRSLADTRAKLAYLIRLDSEDVEINQDVTIQVIRACLAQLEAR